LLKEVQRCDGKNQLPEETGENGFALFGMGLAAIIFGATLPPRF
jgi:hypothetical protein